MRQFAPAAGLVRSVVALAAAAVCAACLDTSTRITVKPDGSGTITQRLLISTKGLEDAFDGMGFKSTGSARRKGSPRVSELRTDADRAGEGVTLVSVEPLTAADGFEGAVATYAFKDIRKLRADQFLMPGPAGGSNSDSRTAFTLTRTPQGTTLLTLAFDERPGKKSGPGDNAPKDFPDIGDAKAREMVKTLFRGFKVGLDLEVDGELVRTTADHVDGRRITLMAFDMDALLADEKALARLESVKGSDLAELRPLLAGVDGIKINKPIVKVEFR